ncbi:MAG TPA: uridine diphosphate-N-acetylglucosamine-binding protein YvcK [Ornithinimicrobium sp.]|uniref:gluconeogenesis factor YvcK family protein n=1 Tax=Ornithinimicrobium sp. TaxID=1977084 RepID=UPI002B489299|nr:uridine diphosphate-N-acetylglucosamine-binding protein YvcK [Ornithinimicrobium sp.]HKJ11588.1 uridine diphosphate-N-acetylglucosamine-binding protein YvcK [Ornithinimicrobium sp.]
MTGPRTVALGGGHGLSASLRALRHLSENITAVVTVADDGGSSGRLREEFDILPPGDLRMALASLCEDTSWGHQWASVLQHRLGGDGELSGHALGNLLLMSLWELSDDPVRALEIAGRLLNIRGRVLPMSTVPLAIEAVIQGEGRAERVRGQSAVASSRGRLLEMTLAPPSPPACAEAVEAITLADWVILGPGSWFTSVMPHLLVPGLRKALEQTPAHRILTLNVGTHDTETRNMVTTEHIDVLRAHAPDLTFDYVIADPTVTGGEEDALRETCSRMGAELVVSAVGKRSAQGQHDTLRLAAAFRDVMSVPTTHAGPVPPALTTRDGGPSWPGRG